MTVFSIHMISAFVTSSLCRNEVKPFLASVVDVVMFVELESEVAVTNTAEVVDVIAMGTALEVEDGPAVGITEDVVAKKWRLFWCDANCCSSW